MNNEINKTSINGIISTLLAVILVFSSFLAAEIKQCENQEIIIENQQTIISEISEIKTTKCCYSPLPYTSEKSSLDTLQFIIDTIIS